MLKLINRYAMVALSAGAVLLATGVLGPDGGGHLVTEAQAAGGGAVQSGWSPTAPYPTQEV